MLPSGNRPYRTFGSKMGVRVTLRNNSRKSNRLPGVPRDVGKVIRQLERVRLRFPRRPPGSNRDFASDVFVLEDASPDGAVVDLCISSNPVIGRLVDRSAAGVHLYRARHGAAHRQTISCHHIPVVDHAQQLARRGEEMEGLMVPVPNHGDPVAHDAVGRKAPELSGPLTGASKLAHESSGAIKDFLGVRGRGTDQGGGRHAGKETGKRRAPAAVSPMTWTWRRTGACFPSHVDRLLLLANIRTAGFGNLRPGQSTVTIRPRLRDHGRRLPPGARADDGEFVGRGRAAEWAEGVWPVNSQVLNARRISSAVPYQLDYASRIQ